MRENITFILLLLNPLITLVIFLVLVFINPLLALASIFVIPSAIIYNAYLEIKRI